MAKYIVVKRESADSGSARLIDFTPDPALPLRDQGIAAIKEAFGEQEGTYYYALLSTFGTLVASRTTEVTFT